MMTPIVARVAARFAAAEDAVADYYRGWILLDRFNHAARTFNQEIVEAAVSIIPLHLQSDGVEWRSYGESGVSATLKGANKLDEDSTITIESWGEGRVTVEYEDMTGRRERRSFRVRARPHVIQHDLARWISGW